MIDARTGSGRNAGPRFVLAMAPQRLASVRAIGMIAVERFSEIPMRKIALAPAVLLVAALSAPILAQQDGPPALPGIADPGKVMAGTYTADPAHTLVGWRVNHFGFNDYFGLFGDIEGTLEIDPAALADASVTVTIPVAGVTVASSDLKDHLLRPGKDGGDPDFFGPSPAPASFVSTQVVPTGDDRAMVTGDFTLNGVTRPVTLDVHFTGVGAGPMNDRQTVGFEASGIIKRSDFGVSYGVPMVSDEVELDITAAFEMDPA